MKKSIMIVALMLFCTPMFAQQKADTLVMKHDKGIYTINTTTLCNQRGFKGTTPLIVKIQKDKIVSVQALPNMETPKFFDKVKQFMLPAYTDLKFDDYAKVDAVTGATMSSNAVKAHMAEALKYYKKNK